MNPISRTRGVVTLVDPRNVRHEVTCVESFVRDNYELFDSDEDVKQRRCPEHQAGGRRENGSYTRAGQGLRGVIAGYSQTWKGWRLG